MVLLAVLAAVWIGLHIGVAGTGLRHRLVARLGEAGFRGAFSVASVIAIGGLCAAYNTAPLRPLWPLPAALPWLLAAVMLVASILFAGSVMMRNPTGVGGEGAPVRGMALATRHPMLWVFALWATVHVAANGDLASVLFFGAFLVTALAGMPSIDAKLAGRDPVAWRALAAQTSILPGRRHGIPVGRIGWAPFAVGVLLWAVLLAAHPYVIGVPALPWLGRV